MSIPEYNSFSSHQKDIIANILSDDTTKRKRILGSAGSGKTMIMSYCASKLASQEKRVLLIIYNKTLIQQIRYMVNNYYELEKGLFSAEDVSKYVDIDNYHHFMWHNIPDTDTFADLEYTSGNNLTQEQIDGYLFNSSFTFIKYDYIFIDEMQDLKPNSIMSLINFLNPDGKMIVFADKYQHIYNNNQYESETEGDTSHVPAFPHNSGFVGKWTRLTEVFRSNSIIQQKGIEFAKQNLFSIYGEEKINLSGELIDSSIDYYTNYSDSALIKAVKMFNPRQQANTAIIVHDISEVNNICRLLEENGIKYSSILENRRRFNVHLNTLTVSTVKSFKGLEAQNVIYINDSNSTKDEDNFVAVTRAIKKLIIFDISKFTSLNKIYKEFEKDFNETFCNEKIIKPKKFHPVKMNIVEEPHKEISENKFTRKVFVHK